MRYQLQASTHEVCVSDYSTDAVTFEVSYYDERHFARIQALPILSRYAHRGEGANVREATIAALRLLAVRLNDMADGLDT